MSAPPTRVDLHVHSNASDGVLAPAAVVEAAVQGGLDVLALADHDTTAGVAEAETAADGRLRLVPAMEVSTSSDEGETHILGYHLDPAHPLVVAHARNAVARRHVRIREILDKLRQLGITLQYDEVIAFSGDAAPGRPHVARALLQRGLVSSFSEAFDRWLSDQGPAFVPTDLLQPDAAIALIHDAGGAAVWAHPELRDGFEARLGAFADAGLDGVECFRPRNSPADVARIEGAARHHGLLLTGGSDWHGDWHGPLGTFHVPASQLTSILHWTGR